jgi:hypothetical protein
VSQGVDPKFKSQYWKKKKKKERKELGKIYYANLNDKKAKATT